MRLVEFHCFFDSNTTLRVRFEWEQGKVLRFMVRMECRFAESQEWAPIIRCDTAHGYAHCDMLFPYEKPQKTKYWISGRDYGISF